MQTENTTDTTEAPTRETRREGVGIHAVLKHRNTGELSTHMEATRTDLAKHLRENCSEYDVVYVFRGKSMNIKRQTHFTLN